MTVDMAVLSPNKSHLALHNPPSLPSKAFREGKQWLNRYLSILPCNPWTPTHTHSLLSTQKPLRSLPSHYEHISYVNKISTLLFVVCNIVQSTLPNITRGYVEEFWKLSDNQCNNLSLSNDFLDFEGRRVAFGAATFGEKSWSQLLALLRLFVHFCSQLFHWFFFWYRQWGQSI